MVDHSTSDAVQFLQSWEPSGPWVLTSIIIEGGSTSTETFGASDVQKMQDWIEERQGKQNIYFTVNPTLRPVRSKARKTDMAGMKALHIDLDPRAGEDLEKERERAYKLLKEFRPAPTVIIDSGGGFQAFWLLDAVHSTGGSEEKAAEFEAYNQQLEVLLQSDATGNIDRIMRLPGTINVPGEKKRKKGRVPRLATVVEVDWTRIYSLKQFTAAPRVQVAESSGPAVKISGNLPRLESLDELGPGVSDRLKAMIVQGTDPEEPGKYGSRSEAAWAVMCMMVRAGCTDDQIAAVILDPDYKISGHVLDQPRPQQYAARQIQRAREEAIDPNLRRLNEDHAVIEDIGGKCRVISEVMDFALQRSRISRQSFEDFRNRYMHIQVRVGTDKDGNEITMPLGKWWLTKAERRQYKTIVFAPGREVKDAYNLWKGFACEARPGKCDLLLAHIRDNVCGGNTTYSEYMINWMARCVQKPDTPGEVAVILRGRMGTGKGVFIKAFGSLWGRHFLQVTDSKHLVGSFNAHLRDCVVLFADEAFYAGDKKHEAILKGLVTEETIMIEGKGVDAEMSPNFVHLLMASNSDWVVPAGADERRYFVLDVSDLKMQDKAYFRAIREELENGGREALLHYLMTRDISKFDVRQFPKTSALQEQKLLSMSTEEQWWYEKLMDGRNSFRHDNWVGEVLKSDIQADYLHWCEQQKVMRRANATGLGKFLKRVMPNGRPRPFQRWAEVSVQDRFGHENTKRVKAWYYELVSLEDARAHWDDRFGGPYQWPTEEAEDAREPF